MTLFVRNTFSHVVLQNTAVMPRRMPQEAVDCIPQTYGFGEGKSLRIVENKPVKDTTTLGVSFSLGIRGSMALRLGFIPNSLLLE